MFTWFSKKKALIARIQELNHRLEESRQVTLEQRKQIASLQAANRVLKDKYYKGTAARSKAPQGVPRPSKIDRALTASDVARSITKPSVDPGYQSTKRAEDSGSDFLLGTVTGLVVSEIFKNDDSSSSSNRSSDYSSGGSSSGSCSSSGSSDSSFSSGGGGDFGGGGSSGDY